MTPRGMIAPPVQLLKRTLTVTTKPAFTNVKEGKQVFHPAKVEHVAVELDLDWKDFQALVIRAAKNQSKKAKVGPFRVRVLSRKEA